MLSKESISEVLLFSAISITKTSPCKEHPLIPHFYIVKLGFTGVYFFVIFAPKHRLWVLVRTASVRCNHNLCFEQKKKNIKNFHLKIIIFTAVKNCSILHGRVFIMGFHSFEDSQACHPKSKISSLDL